MRKLSFYPKLAARSIKNNRQFYLPYILTVIGTCAAMYILYALNFDPGFDQLGAGTTNGQAYVQFFMQLGIVMVSLFCFIFLVYTNSFLMKRRTKELGLYNVLGMGKKNIAGILVFESLYIAVIGIVLGLALGVLLHKLMMLLLYWLMRLPAPFGFAVQVKAMVNTSVFFVVIIFLTLLLNLWRVGRSKPVELLRGGNVGEKEPRINWLVVVIGVLTLGGGYFIAVWVKDSVTAIAFYFVAVFLVIIGTYCLFTSLSILALKALKKNKRYYYKSKHFISVSGMLYRMKRNGVGLANICIIATMVMVMISGTLSLYLGCDEVVRLNTPTDIVVQGRHYYHYTTDENGEIDPEQTVPINPEALNNYVLELFAEAGAEPTSGYQIEDLDVNTEVITKNGTHVSTEFYIITADTYAAITGEEAPVLGKGEALAVLSVPGANDQLREGFSFQEYDLDGNLTGNPGPEFTIVGECENILNNIVRTDALLAAGEENYVLMVVDGTETLDEIGKTTVTGIYYWEGRYNFATLSDAEQNALYDAFWAENHDFSAADCGYVAYFRTDTRVDVESDIFGLAGGFLFLGVFLGLVFMMAAVLIIYYKQVSEGYEDQRRFDIMRKVGLSRREARRSIRSQILTVFFLPLIVAAVHIAFDFKLVLQLLTLFALRNTTLTALCTLGTLAAFCLIYALVYMLTARAYYKIVDARPQESRS
ncbi:MAG TPA: ABC transporter permease [Candidatus Scatomorpha pullicola]|nr:ABC transporter permease [Candidatus Scatomorpha pullicola]